MVYNLRFIWDPYIHIFVNTSQYFQFLFAYVALWLIKLLKYVKITEWAKNPDFWD